MKKHFLSLKNNFQHLGIIDLLHFFSPYNCSERLCYDSAQKPKTTKNGYLFKNNKDFRSIPWTSCMLLYWQKTICFCNMGISAADKWFIYHEPNLVWTCVSKWPKYWQLTWSKMCYYMYRVSHSKPSKVILLWRRYRLWFLLIFWILRVHEKGTFMLNSSVLIFLMLCALYRMICKNAKWFFGKNSLNVSNVKLFSKSFFQYFWLFYAFLVRMTACTFHIKWFPWHQEPK